MKKCVTHGTHGKAFNKVKCLYVKLVRMCVVMKIRLCLSVFTISIFSYLWNRVNFMQCSMNVCALGLAICLISLFFFLTKHENLIYFFSFLPVFEDDDNVTYCNIWDCEIIQDNSRLLCKNVADFTNSGWYILSAHTETLSFPVIKILG